MSDLRRALATLLDPFTGRETSDVPQPLLHPSGMPMHKLANIRAGWSYGTRNLEQHSARLEEELKRAPNTVQNWLDKARWEQEKRRSRIFDPMRASGQGWEEVIWYLGGDGTQVLNTTTETIMLPDATLGAGYCYPGRILKYTILGNVSTVITTPGTITAALRYGGVAGTALATSGAFAPDPTAASTTQTCMFEFWTTVRGAFSTAASSFTIGRAIWGDYDDASATALVGNLNMTMIPSTAPAAVNINTLTSNALSPTIKFSVATATTQFTANIAQLESLN